MPTDSPSPRTVSETHTSEANEVLIVGGGMAGSLLALVLARLGRRVQVIDLHRTLGPEFRNEKLGIDQIARITSLGVRSCFEEACWGWDEAERPRRRPDLKDSGARYDRWVERLRAAWPATVGFVEGKVDRIEAGDEVQTAVLTDGRRVSGRLAVLATGRGERLRAALGVSRRVLSERHSVCVGFSIQPRMGDVWDAQARVVHGRPGEPLAYATVFPMMGEVRVNLFTYAGMDDPWVRALRGDPLRVLTEAAPQLAGLLEGASLVRKVEVRSTDLYAMSGHVRSGVVLLGDAYHAPCPASGTGMTRILNDVERLVRVHIPQWLATPGMGADKIAAFYADPIKQEVDRASLRKSMNGRASALSQTPYWRLRRRIGWLKRRLIADPTHVPTGPTTQAATGAATSTAPDEAERRAA